MKQNQVKAVNLAGGGKDTNTVAREQKELEKTRKEEEEELKRKQQEEIERKRKEKEEEDEKLAKEAEELRIKQEQENERRQVIFNQISNSYLTNSPPCQVAYSSLVEWTNNFVCDNDTNSIESSFGKLGEGAFGEVFKGLVINSSDSNKASGFRIAVKRLIIDFTILHIANNTDDMIRSFQREVHVLSQFKHPNLVKLVAYCPPDIESKMTGCLVYELLAQGGLNTHLTDDAKAQSLLWSTRVNILLEVASAINYLHSSTPGSPAYHRDIKASNVALTSSYSAKLIDCGLSKYTSDDNVFGKSIKSATGFRAGTIGIYYILLLL
ncbi:MAG: hypothetical protein EBX37_11210 [Alphaproteobacteria bacterium]|nr:hypothetical protein [Alphaproteobacteria bacterium]